MKRVPNCKFTEENSVEIDAKSLNDYCKKYARDHSTTVTCLLADNDIPAATITNSVRSYWLRHEGRGKKSGHFCQANGLSAFGNEKLNNGLVKKETYERLCKTFGIKDPKTYILKKEVEEVKEKPKAKAPSEYMIESHLKDIKELLKAQNILLNKLLKAWEE